jgi:hypothetical protein
MIKQIKFTITQLILLFVFAVGILSCDSEIRDEITIDDLPDPISFSEHIIPIFEQNCIQCHNGTTPPDLTADNAYLDLVGGGYINFENPIGSKLYQSIAVGGNMYQHATDLDRVYVLKWIENGSDDN